MQKKISESQRLLDRNGHLNQSGYANSLLLNYDRRDIRANRFRIKEWDYYLIQNRDYAFALTIADNSYMGLASVSLLDLKTPWQITSGSMKILPLGKTRFPSTSKEGDVRFHDKRVSIEFLNDGRSRHLLCDMKDFSKGKNLKADIILTDEPDETMVIATPFRENGKAFYYNQKINCLRASGSVTYNDREYLFCPDRDFAVLDWGRGVWTYSNTWYWGTASGLVNEVPFGFNIGYGFGDTSAASENMLFYDGKASKLDQVTFHIPKDQEGREDYLKPWSFTSSDGRFEMEFIPIIDRSDYQHILFLSSDQHQIFGRFSGKAILDDGTILRIEDFPGAAEKVKNKW